MTQPQKNNALIIITSTIGALFLIIPAFYNGYPLVNPDTGSYLSAFIPAIPFDRPMTYGFLVRVLSLNGFSLWPVIFFQAYMVCWLILKIIKHTTNTSYLLSGLLIIIFLSLDTSLSWTMSQVQPDITTSIALLSLTLILMQKESKTVNTLLYVLFFFSVASHISHLVLFILLLAVYFLFRKKLMPNASLVNKNRIILTLLIIIVATYSTMSAAMSKSKHGFMMATLLEQGILKPYLDEHCPTDRYAICVYKDSLPVSGDAFLWSPKSPLNKTGWQASKTEYNKIINGTYTEPKYLGMHIRASLEATWNQIFNFAIGAGNAPIASNEYTNQQLARYIPQEIKAFTADKQNTTNLTRQLYLPNMLLKLVVLISLLSFAFLFILKFKLFSSELKLFLFLSVLCLIINVWDCGTFAVVNARYGSKLIWLIPFSALLVSIAPLSSLEKPEA